MGFFKWVRQTLDTIGPEHLRSLAIIGAGVSVYPGLFMLGYIVWLGYSRSPELQAQSLGIMGVALFICLGLFGMVVLAMLGTVKSLRVEGPGGLGFELDTTEDDPDQGPDTPRRERHRRERDRGGFQMPHIPGLPNIPGLSPRPAAPAAPAPAGQKPTPTSTPAPAPQLAPEPEPEPVPDEPSSKKDDMTVTE